MKFDYNEYRDRVHSLLLLAPRFPEAVRSLGDRREQVAQDRVPQDLLSGHTVESYSLPSPVSTESQ